MRILPPLCLVLTILAGDALACGTERWPVKVGEDPDAKSVDLKKTVPTTIAALDALPAPADRPEDSRIHDTEMTVYVIEATLTAYKLETDGDYHLALSDGAGHTLIAEIPDPACVGDKSPFLEGIKKARVLFDGELTAGKSYRKVSIPITVIGVGFFDFDHHQRGVAPNAIELHPVVDIYFTAVPPPVAATRASPGHPKEE